MVDAIVSCRRKTKAQEADSVSTFPAPQRCDLEEAK